MTGMELIERTVARAVVEVVDTLFPGVEPDVRCVLMQAVRRPMVQAGFTIFTVAQKGTRKPKVKRIDLSPSRN